MNMFEGGGIETLLEINKSQSRDTNTANNTEAKSDLDTILKNLNTDNWPELYEQAVDGVMNNPTWEIFRTYSKALVDNCPNEYRQMMRSALKMLVGYVKSEHQKGVDDMTSLYKQNIFYQSLDNVLSKADRHGGYVSVLAIDADNFKEINDNFGHQEGDRAIKYVADTVKKVARQEDIAARYGGDEFAVILDKTDNEGAYRFAERIQQEMENNPFKLLDGSQLYLPSNIGNISLSYGIATETYNGGAEGFDSKELFNRADQACYKAKKGPEKIVSYDVDIIPSYIPAKAS